jgi:dipeptidyl aminopeptidase/acylaminoacyl peptidase
MSEDAIRRIPYVSWTNSDAWMESMSGPRWKSIVKRESELVDTYTQLQPIRSRVGEFVASLAAANESVDELPFDCGPAVVYWISQFQKHWRFHSESILHEARDIDATNNTVWVTTDVGKGAESFALQMWSKSSPIKPVWTEYPVGPEVALQNGYVYYLSVKNKLIYHEVWRCDAKTGKSKVCIYKESSPKVNLSLEKHADGHLILVRDNSQNREYFEIRGTRLYPFDPYVCPNSWKMPNGEYGLSFIWPRMGLCITKQHGQKILWKVDSKLMARPILKIPAGFIQLDPYAVWMGRTPLLVRVITPYENPAYYSFQRNLQLVLPRKSLGLKWKRFSEHSADGTLVHGILIYQENSIPSCLLCIGYGAYGLETGVSSVMRQWAPLLTNQWAIVYTFPRGGGDHTDEWGKAGRREGRYCTLEDFVALIRATQSYLHIPPSKTVIYGRSAGGLLMGMTLTKYPDGTLMKGVYTEVPYVDVLRTTTNPTLPLTRLEYNEFGDPAHRLEDFVTVGLQSPADSASVTASRPIFVLTRTAENDSQVYAYESVKWIRRLRSHDTVTSAPKLCIIETDQGHFTPPDRQVEQRGLDCAFLDAWCKIGSLSLR